MQWVLSTDGSVFNLLINWVLGGFTVGLQFERYGSPMQTWNNGNYDQTCKPLSDSTVWFEKWLYKYNIKRHHVLSSHAGIFVSKQSAGVSSSVHRRQLRQKMFKMSTRGGVGAMGDEEWREFLRKSLIFAIIKNDGLLGGNRALRPALSIETLKHNHVKIINFQRKWWLVVK